MTLPLGVDYRASNGFIGIEQETGSNGQMLLGSR